MYTVQVCCSAVGKYVVYKGLHLYNTWCAGGPDDAKYTCSKSGWMEANQFVEWFDKVFIRETVNLEGGKLLIFDGHNSHLTKEVVDLALANNIELLCLPAHTSSVLQPLNVGVFKTVKSIWRTSLKKYYDETRYKNVDKGAFPMLLKTAIEHGAFNRSNAINAFEACGIYPLNRQKITPDKLSTSEPLITGANMSCPPSDIDSSLPVADMSSSSLPNLPEVSTNEGEIPVVTLTPRKHIEAALLKHLRNSAPKDTENKRKRIRRTLAECLTSVEAVARLTESGLAKNVVAKKKSSKSVSNKTRVTPCVESSVAEIEAVESSDSESETYPIPGPSGSHKTKQTEMSESSESDCNMQIDDDSDDSIEDTTTMTKFISQLKKDKHVAVVYDGKWYPAKIEKTIRDDISVQFMEIKGINKFRWPEKEDRLIVPLDDVLCMVDEPTVLSQRHMKLSSYDFDAANAAFISHN